MLARTTVSTLSLLAILLLSACGGTDSESDSGDAKPDKKVFLAIGTGTTAPAYGQTDLVTEHSFTDGLGNPYNSNARPAAGSVSVTKIASGGVNGYQGTATFALKRLEGYDA